MSTLFQTNLWKDQRSYAVQVRMPSTPDRGRWPTIALFTSEKAAERFEQRLEKAQDKAERQYDRNGGGDTSSPDKDEQFQVQKRMDGKFYVVHKDGGDPVGSYDDEKKANAVANALNDEIETVEEEDEECVDPDTWGGGRYPDGRDPRI